jgi:hypothetical protein
MLMHVSKFKMWRMGAMGVRRASMNVIVPVVTKKAHVM